MDQIISNVRREVHSQLQEENDQKLRRWADSVDLAQKELQEVKLQLSSKEKELQLMEDGIKGIERRTLDDMEIMRKKLTTTLWEEYEKKLTLKKNEFDHRFSNNLEEIERLSSAVREWRKKCIELEEKNSQLYSSMNTVNDKDYDLMRDITNYENRITNLERELEKTNQLYSDTLSSQSIQQDKTRLLENSLNQLQDKRYSVEEQLMDRDSQVKALERELERCRTEGSGWRSHLERSEAENARLKLQIMDLENTLHDNSKFKGSNIKELQWEKAANDRYQADVLNLESELKTALSSNSLLSQQISRLAEEIQAKSDLIDEYKRNNTGSRDSFQGLLIDIAQLKSVGAKDQDMIKLLQSQLQRLSTERNDLLFKLDADKLRNSRHDRSSITMLARGRDNQELENNILREKVSEAEVQIKALRTKLGQLSTKTTDLVYESQRLVTENIQLQSKLANTSQKIDAKPSNETKSSTPQGLLDQQIQKQYQVDIDRANDNLSQQVQKNKELVIQIEKLENSLNGVQSENEKYTVKMMEIDREAGRLKQLLSDKQSQITQSNEQRTDKDQTAVLQIENHKLIKEMQSLKTDHSNTLISKQQIYQQQIAQELHSKQVQVEQAINQIEILQSEKQSMQVQITKLTRDMQLLQREFDQAESDHQREKFVQTNQPQPPNTAANASLQFEGQGDLRASQGIEILKLEVYIKELLEELDVKDKIINQTRESMNMSGDQYGIQNQQLITENQYMKAISDHRQVENQNLQHANNILIDEVQLLKNENNALSKQLSLLSRQQASVTELPSNADRSSTRPVLSLKSTEPQQTGPSIREQQMSAEIQSLIMTNHSLNTRNIELENQLHELSFIRQNQEYGNKAFESEIDEQNNHLHRMTKLYEGKLIECQDLQRQIIEIQDDSTAQMRELRENYERQMSSTDSEQQRQSRYQHGSVTEQF